jgi:hypothetical protein
MFMPVQRPPSFGRTRWSSRPQGDRRRSAWPTRLATLIAGQVGRPAWKFANKGRFFGAEFRAMASLSPPRAKSAAWRAPWLPVFPIPTPDSAAVSRAWWSRGIVPTPVRCPAQSYEVSIWQTFPPGSKRIIDIIRFGWPRFNGHAQMPGSSMGERRGQACRPVTPSPLYTPPVPIYDPVNNKEGHHGQQRRPPLAAGAG